MATFYIDFENGTDADGTSVANKRNSLLGISPSAGDTIKVVGSPNPTLVGTASAKMAYGFPHWNKNSFGTITYSTTKGETTISSLDSNLETGDTIQITSNTNGQNINGTWRITSTSTSGTYKIDEFTGTSATTGTGGGWWPSTSKCLYLDSTPIINLASTGQRSSAWTAAANVTCSLDENNSPEWASSGRRTWEHARSDKIVIGTDHGTGLAAYYPITELTGNTYEQISLYGMQASGTRSDGGLSLRLCTNNDGTGSVKTIPINFKSSENGLWRPFVKDFDESLTSDGNIKSVALYVDTDDGAKTIHLSNIIGCKAADQNDSITHFSLIGWNTTADPVWRPIETITALSSGKTRITFPTSTIKAEHVGYYAAGRSAGFAADYSSANIYKRETCKMQDTVLASHTQPVGISSSWGGGTAGNETTIQGGWNSDFTSQNLDHSIVDHKWWYHGCNLSAQHIKFEKMGIARLGHKLAFGGDNQFVDDFISAGSGGRSQYGIHIVGSKKKLILNAYVCCGAYGLYWENGKCIVSNGDNATTADKANYKVGIYGGIGSSNYFMYIGNTSNHLMLDELVLRGCGYFSHSMRFQDSWAGTCYVNNFKQSSQYNGVQTENGKTIDIKNWENKNISNSPLYLYKGAVLNATTFTDVNGSGYKYQPSVDSIRIDGSSIAKFTNGPAITDRRVYALNGVLFSDNDNFTGTYASNPMYIAVGSWHKRNANQVSGAFENVYKNGFIYPNTSIRKTASGYSWKFTTQNSSNATTTDPLSLDLGAIAVNASALVTVKVWTYRTHSDAKGRIKIKANTLIGLAVDQTTETSGNINEWVEITKTFTPTTAGFADISLEGYGGSGQHVYFDDLTITQA